MIKYRLLSSSSIFALQEADQVRANAIWERLTTTKLASKHLRQVIIAQESGAQSEYKDHRAEWEAAQNQLDRIKAFHTALVNGNVTAKQGDDAAALAEKLEEANKIAVDFADVFANVPKQ